jgi:transcriptional regulator with XRE-family HTH domain
MENKNKIADRFREVREMLGGITQAQLASRLLISRNYVGKIEAGIQEPSARIIADLERLRMSVEERMSSIYQQSAAAPTAVGEELSSASSRKAADPATPIMQRVQLNPQFAPPPEQPTAQHCQAYLAEYLQRAKQVPGGIAHTFVELQEHFPLSRWQRHQEKFSHD